MIADIYIIITMAKLQFMVWAPWAPKGAGLPGLHMVLGSIRCWAPYGAGLLGLWAPEGDVLSGLSMVLGSLGCWAPEVTGLPS